jgi:hypothetical protein
VESKVGPLDTSATSGLLYLHRVTVRMENFVEWRLAGETDLLGENLPQRHFVTDLLGENLPQRHFVHHKSYVTRPGLEPGEPWWGASD